MQLANFVRERWKGVLFCLIIAIPATLLGKQIEVVGGPVFAILFGMVLALVFPKNRREQLAVGVTYTSKPAHNTQPQDSTAPACLIFLYHTEYNSEPLCRLQHEQIP